uniref:U3 small nucleolar RNA-associated protein 14 homolog A n=1 Tax=Accipiter nisus TaxID=211598 RepID=A0A8B9RTQ4_9AVES
MQKARVMQSYYEAKARREKKIKSKKYHRVLKKTKRRKALKEFELLHKSDPEAALARLEELEQLRMQERMSLKHQNKGKWARSRAIMAKYDLEVRTQNHRRVWVGRDLQRPSSPTPTHSPPWAGTPSTRPGCSNKEEVEEEEEMSEEEALLQDFAQKRHVRQQHAGSPEGQGEELTREAVSELPGDSPVHPVCAEEQASLGIEQPPQAQEEILLSEQLGRVRTMEDVEALASEECVEEQEKPAATRAEKRVQQQEEGRAENRCAKKPPAKKKMISLQAVLSGKPQEVQCPSLPVIMEEEEGGIDQRGVITEAFAGDDVVADFRREKRKAEQAAKPQPVNLVLPGWGEWGGMGLKPSAKKVKRFLLKPPSAPPRKDQHLPHVIMSEKRNIHVAAHQVSELPFPFERHQQFEQSIRTPVGPTWNTQRAFQKLTAPRVITRAGHIIQPISAEDIPDVATAAGSGAKPALEIAPKRQEQTAAALLPVLGAPRGAG